MIVNSHGEKFVFGQESCSPSANISTVNMSPLLLLNVNLKRKVTSAFSFLFVNAVSWGIKYFPGILGHKVGDSLDAVPTHCRAQAYTPWAIWKHE